MRKPLKHVIDELLKLVRINAEAEKDPSLDEEARRMVPQTGKWNEALALWQWFRDEEFEWNSAVFTMNCKSNLTLQRKPFYNDKMDAVVDILAEKDFLLSQRAQVVNLEIWN